MGIHAPDDTVAQVVALSAAGHSSRAVAEAVGVDRRKVSRWLQRPDLAQELSEARLSLAYRWSVLLDKMLDKVDKEEITLSPQQILVGYGISQDKVIQSHSITLNVGSLNLAIAERAQSFKELEDACIEGEAHEV